MATRDIKCMACGQRFYTVRGSKLHKHFDGSGLKVTAKERREQAIKDVVDSCTNEDFTFKHDVDVVELSQRIDDMVTLGRTAKWQDAVKKWAKMVAEKTNGTQWAVLQGAINTGWEA